MPDDHKPTGPKGDENIYGIQPEKSAPEDPASKNIQRLPAYPGESEDFERKKADALAEAKDLLERLKAHNQQQADAGSSGEGGSLMGWVVFILIFGVGNLILYSTTGIVIIPIPRR
jgi:hypothetical protein